MDREGTEWKIGFDVGFFGGSEIKMEKGEKVRKELQMKKKQGEWQGVWKKKNEKEQDVAWELIHS